MTENLELEFYFERMKNEILNKVRKSKEKWQKIQRKALGDPAAENELIQLKLQIQIMEAQALEELERLEKKIKGTEGDD